MLPWSQLSMDWYETFRIACRMLSGCYDARRCARYCIFVILGTYFVNVNIGIVVKFPIRQLLRLHEPKFTESNVSLSGTWVSIELPSGRNSLSTQADDGWRHFDVVFRKFCAHVHKQSTYMSGMVRGERGVFFYFHTGLNISAHTVRKTTGYIPIWNSILCLHFTFWSVLATLHLT